jgi:hypothetical protein
MELEKRRSSPTIEEISFREEVETGASSRRRSAAERGARECIVIFRLKVERDNINPAGCEMQAKNEKKAKE